MEIPGVDITSENQFSIFEQLKRGGTAVGRLSSINAENEEKAHIGWVYFLPDGTMVETVQRRIGAQDCAQGNIVVVTTVYNQDGEIIRGPSYSCASDRPI